MPTLTDPHLSLVREVTPRAEAARSASPSAPSGCTCGCASPAATWAAATLPHCGTRAHSTSATKHPIVQSFEPGEDWSWCYVDETFV